MGTSHGGRCGTWAMLEMPEGGLLYLNDNDRNV